VIGWHFWALLQEISANSDCVMRDGVCSNWNMRCEPKKYLLPRCNEHVGVNQAVGVRSVAVSGIFASLSECVAEAPFCLT
jgi:hypothetical protein